MKDSFGHALQVTLFGESHGAAIGAVVQGITAGITLDPNFLDFQMDKRRAAGAISTQRQEPDKVQFLSGVVDNVTTGTAITLMIENTNTKSKDYSKTQYLLRPGHADFTAFEKYRGFQDFRGGGHFSGRLTAPIVAAGSLFHQMLRDRQIFIATHLLECAGISDAPFSTDHDQLQAQINHLHNAHFSVIDPKQEDVMKAEIVKASEAKDSVGGILETVVYGLPTGLGEPFFSSVESVLSPLLFSIPAVKGLEFGTGFGFSKLKGSEANDPFQIKDGRISTTSNHNGGINGGITNGMPLIFRTVVKPTPSIYQQQQTVDYQAKENTTLEIHGRHDPCIVHRARVVQDSMVAIGIADLCNMMYGMTWQEQENWKGATP